MHTACFECGYLLRKYAAPARFERAYAFGIRRASRYPPAADTRPYFTALPLGIPFHPKL